MGWGEVVVGDRTRLGRGEGGVEEEEERVEGITASVRAVACCTAIGVAVGVFRARDSDGVDLDVGEYVVAAVGQARSSTLSIGPEARLSLRVQLPGTHDSSSGPCTRCSQKLQTPTASYHRLHRLHRLIPLCPLRECCRRAANLPASSSPAKPTACRERPSHRGIDPEPAHRIARCIGRLSSASPTTVDCASDDSTSPDPSFVVVVCRHGHGHALRSLLT